MLDPACGSGNFISGIRRAGAINADLAALDLKAATVTTPEKGGGIHACKIGVKGLVALMDYLKRERAGDEASPQPPAPSIGCYACGSASAC